MGDTQQEEEHSTRQGTRFQEDQDTTKHRENRQTNGVSDTLARERTELGVAEMQHEEKGYTFKGMMQPRGGNTHTRGEWFGQKHWPKKHGHGLRHTTKRRAHTILGRIPRGGAKIHQSHREVTIPCPEAQTETKAKTHREEGTQENRQWSGGNTQTRDRMLGGYTCRRRNCIAKGRGIYIVKGWIGHQDRARTDNTAATRLACEPPRFMPSLPLIGNRGRLDTKHQCSAAILSRKWG